MNFLTVPPTNCENTVTIVVTEVIGDNLCIACEDAEKVYEKIAAAFREGKKAIVSFKNCEDITSAFLADAIGQLYHNFSEQKILSSLNIIDMQPIDQADLEATIYWTKQYLKDPKRYMIAIRESFGENFYE